MSDTPRTDMFCRTVDHTVFVDGKICQATIEMVDASFARQLERELAEARAEIERLKEYTTCTLVSADAEMDDKDVEIAKRDKLIEQMRDVLQEVMVLCDAVPTRAHDMAKDYHLREIGRIVNVKGLYRVVKAALSAAERMSDEL